MCLEKLRSLKIVFLQAHLPLLEKFLIHKEWFLNVKSREQIFFPSFPPKSTIKWILSGFKEQDSGWCTLFEIFGLVISNLFSDSQIICF